EDDASAGSDRAHYRLHDAQRIGDVLEDEARVGDVERAPVAAEVEVQDVAGAVVDRDLVAFIAREPHRLGALLVAALDADDAAARHRARHGPRELAEAGAEVDDALVAAQRELA